MWTPLIDCIYRIYTKTKQSNLRLVRRYKKSVLLQGSDPSFLCSSAKRESSFRNIWVCVWALLSKGFSCDINECRVVLWRSLDTVTHSIVTKTRTPALEHHVHGTSQFLTLWGDVLKLTEYTVVAELMITLFQFRQTTLDTDLVQADRTFRHRRHQPDVVCV